MISNQIKAGTETHEVFNQPPPLEDLNLFEQDAVLREGLHREGAAWAEDRVSEVGAIAGSAHMMQLGHTANQNGPVLNTHDRYGHRIDEVEFHPSYHEIMKIWMEAGAHSLAWTDPRPGSHVARASMAYLLSQPDTGIGCPMAMTFSVVPALRQQPEIAEEWVPRVTSTEYDPRFIPAPQKRGATMGMAMTEKQGGSDVRSNTTRALPLGAGGPGHEYELTGHKWFCSAPMCDAFMTLAQTENGLSCFIVPRWLPDGNKNAFYIQRLKDKVGNRSNASSEVEFRATWARMVGEEGRGVPTIIEMVNHTRLECVMGSAAIMRQALSQATHHAAHRLAFKKLLIDQPLMKNVLADLAIESEAATLTMLRLARAYDEGRENAGARLFTRIATALSKYWVCKRCPSMTYEALECLGGNGFVEETLVARLFRDSPLNSVWEGSGNVICIDVLRAMSREPDSLEAFLAELGEAEGGDARLDEYVRELKDQLRDTADIEVRARRVVARMALAFQASLMVRYAPPASADAFIGARLSPDRDLVFGTLNKSTEFDKIIDRARPQVG